jgi:aarF domain-containing kinase
MTSRILFKRSSRWTLAAYAAVGGSAAYVIDDRYCYRICQRSLRAAYVGVYTVVNYKLLWNAENSHEVNERVAKAITDCCMENEGLYVKIGQALCSMGPILPREYLAYLGRLLDRAKTYEYTVIKALIDQELGEGILRDIEVAPVGSASVAQVHRAVYVPTGEIVAVKVQKPNVSFQAEWDLLVYKILLHCLEFTFDIPLVWSADFVCANFRAELDFRLEADNSEQAKRQLLNLGDVVYVPRVIKSTRKVLVTEWIEDATMISDVQKLKRQGFNCKSVVMDATNIFGYQIFTAGHVHCDPHPGNLLVRQKPGASLGTHQIVLIDHGLYVDLPEQLRKDYALLWMSMAPPSDTATIDRICQSWGIGASKLFQVLVKSSNGSGANQVDPYQEIGKQMRKSSAAELNRAVKENLRKLLMDTSKFPKELIFVGRCMNYIKAAHWTHGSPVDRVAVLVDCARRSNVEVEPAASTTVKSWFTGVWTSLLRWLPGASAYDLVVTEEDNGVDNIDNQH